MKWWLGARYNGYTKNEVKLCKCEAKETLTTKHVLNCHLYHWAFVDMGTEVDLTPEEIKELLTGHRFENWKEWRSDNLEKLIQMETVLSEKVRLILDPEVQAKA